MQNLSGQALTVPGIKKTDFLFFLSYGIYMIFSILQTTLFYQYYEGTLYQGILALCLLVLVVREVMLDIVPFSQLPLIVLTMIFILLLAKDGPATRTALLAVYIFSARNMDFKKIAKFTWILSSLVLIFLIASCQAGWIRDYYEYWNGRTRHYLGFLYALFAPTVLFNITALYVYWRGRKIRWAELAILTAANYGMYRLTDARLCFLTSCMVIFMTALLKIWPNMLHRLKIIDWLMILSYPVSFAAMCYLTAAYRPFGWMKTLNSRLMDRLRLGHNSWVEYGVRWFGQKITWIGNGLAPNGNHVFARYNYVDSLYIQVIQRYGIVFTVLILVVLTCVMYHLYRRGEYLLLFIMAVLALHAMIDDLIFNLNYNSFWLIIGQAVVQAARDRKKKIIVTEGMHRIPVTEGITGENKG